MAPTYQVAYNSKVQVAVAIGAIIVWSILNIFRIDRVGWIEGASAFFQISSVIIIVVAALVLPPSLNDGNFVFGRYHSDDTSNTDFNSHSYDGSIGLLFAAFCFVGYEASGKYITQYQYILVA